VTTAILVGAGASLAEALPGRPSRDRRPPLDATFFELCRLAKLEGRASVKSYMGDAFGMDPFSGEYRMEEVFNFIYSEAFSDDASQECLSAYWSLIRMYAAAIARTTNDLQGTSRFGVGALLRALDREDPDEDYTFVTFNQDLVIEKSIEAAKSTTRYTSIPWNLRTAYGIDFEDFLGVRSRPRFMMKRRTIPSIQVLKLHGSLNWFYNVRSGSDPRNSIRRPAGNLHCLTNQRVLSGLQYQGKSRSIDIIPLLIPPIYEKASRYQTAVGPVWSAARSLFQGADRIIVFGYSFPDADIAARSLLRAAFHQNRTLSEVTVIDASPDVAAGIAQLLDVETLHYHRTVPAFVKGRRAFR